MLETSKYNPAYVYLSLFTVKQLIEDFSEKQYEDE